MRSYILLSVLLANSVAAPAQNLILSVGNTTSLTITTGTIFSADSLVLIPGSNFTLSSNDIQMSHVPVSVGLNPSIDRVYYLSNPISFTGTIQLYYQPSELNGIPESSLKYTDSTGGTWLAESTSSVNTSLHYVQFAALNQSFNGSTASGPITVLLLSLMSFTGNWNQEYPALDWVVNQTDQTESFDVESSSNATSWQVIGEVNGQDGNGTVSYPFNDNNPSSNNMYYRIKMIDPSGKFAYSNVLELQKAGYNKNIRLTVNNNAVAVYFSGAQPTAVRFINVLGQVLKSDMTSKQEYDINGLNSGVYFFQYELNGQWGVRKFVVE